MRASTLEKAGLTEGESKIYLALLELGQSKAGPIVDRSGVSTSKSYKILKRLEKKGLVSHITKNNVLHWSASNPERILGLLEEKEKDIEKRKEEIESIMPEIKKRINSVRESQEAEVYMGIEGLVTVFRDEVDFLIKNPEETNYILGVTRNYPDKIASFFNRLSMKQDENNLKRKFLFGEDAKGTMPVVENSQTAEVKYLPYASIVSVNIYGETSIISILTEEPIFFVIKSEEVAESFKEYFEVMWKTAKE